MIYHTDYTKDQIISIINTTTLPYNLVNTFAGDSIISEFKKDKIYLWKSGMMGLGIGRLPLVVELMENDKNVIIKCKFRRTKPLIITFILVCSVVWFVMLQSFINHNVSLFAKLFILIALPLGTVFVFFATGNDTYHAKQQNEVIEFIENNLQAKRSSKFNCD